MTLMELLVVLGLIAGLSGILGWRTLPLIEEKRFRSETARMKQEILFLYRMAINTQTDWNLTGVKEGKEWIVMRQALESSALPFSERPQKYCSWDLTLNGQPLEKFTMEFYATGTVAPVGIWQLQSRRSELKDTWSSSDLFHQETGFIQNPWRKVD